MSQHAEYHIITNMIYKSSIMTSYFDTLRDIKTCLAYFYDDDIKQKWNKIQNDQQNEIYRIDQCNCNKELKNFMLRKQTFEHNHHVSNSEVSVLEWSKKSLQYMKQKESLMDQLCNVQKCEDLDKILLEFTIQPILFIPSTNI